MITSSTPLVRQSPHHTSRNSPIDLDEQFTDRANIGPHCIEEEHRSNNEGPPSRLTEVGFSDVADTVELAVAQVDYSLRCCDDGTEVPVVHVFGRQTDGTAEHVIVHGFRPYFYVTDEEFERKGSDLDDPRLTGHQAGFTSIRGTPLTRVYTRTPRDVGELRDRFRSHYEADVLFPNRFLIDLGIKSGVRVPERRRDDGAIEVRLEEIEPIERRHPLRTAFIGIEVDDRSGFPESGNEPILSLTSYDSYSKRYIIWAWASPGGRSLPENLPRYEGIAEELLYRVNQFAEEETMLKAFCSYIAATDPDIITGWNVDFDISYLIDRLDVLDTGSEHHLCPEQLSRIGEIWNRNSDSRSIAVKGRAVFDLLYAYRRTQLTEKESYRLDAIAESELGVGKKPYTGSIGDLWERNPERLLEYNLRDVELCVELDQNNELIAFWDELRTFIGCKIEDVPTPGDAVDVYLLQRVFGTFVLPSRSQHRSEDLEGGRVFEPISGIRENVTSLDLASLYPMTIITLNASPETKVNPDEYDGETLRSPNGIHFRKKPEGFLKDLLDALLDERNAKKILRDEHQPGSDQYSVYDRQQAAVKVLMNAMYGVLSWSRFRLYDEEIASAVTATGRAVIQHTSDIISSFGREVTYGDTDGCLIELGPGVSKQEAIDISRSLEERINDSYAAFAKEVLNADEHRFQIEFEKFYRRFFQAGKKKRYAGHVVYREGNDLDDIAIAGFEYRRSDIAQLTKEVQYEVIRKIVRGESKAQIRSYLYEIIQDVRRGRIDIDKVGMPAGIRKDIDEYDVDPAHVRGARYANIVFQKNFKKGSKPKRLYLRNVHPDFFTRIEEELDLDPPFPEEYADFKRNPDVICYEYPEEIPDEFEVDWEEMLGKTLQGPISRVIEPIGLTWDEVKSGQSQSGLSSFY